MGLLRDRSLTYTHTLVPAPNAKSLPLPAFVPPSIDGAPQYIAVEISYWQHEANEDFRGQLADARVHM